MQAVSNIRRFPVQPILVVLTVLFTLVLGLLAGYAAARIDGRAPAAPTHITAPFSTQGPDAQERNEWLRMQQLNKSTGHGQ